MTFSIKKCKLYWKVKVKNFRDSLTSDNKDYLPISVKEGDELFIVGKIVEVMWKL